MSSTLLPRPVYRKVLQGLKSLRKQHELDRHELPNRSPIDWKASLLMMVELTLRTARQPCPKGLADDVLKYLALQGLIVSYLGDGYTFPSKEPLPTREDVILETLSTIKNI